MFMFSAGNNVVNYVWDPEAGVDVVKSKQQLSDEASTAASLTAGFLLISFGIGKFLLF